MINLVESKLCKIYLGVEMYKCTFTNYVSHKLNYLSQKEFQICFILKVYFETKLELVKTF